MEIMSLALKTGYKCKDCDGYIFGYYVWLENTCQYFQLTLEPCNFYSPYFTRTCNRYFEGFIQQFVAKLRVRRIQRLQNLQHLHHLQHLQSPLDNIIHPVDFQIERL